jgi:ferritin-like metal-binding protein YciE
LIQVARLERVFKMLDKPARGETCEAIKGLIEEGEELMEAASGPVCDAGNIGVSQAIEHYEMARYGTLIAWARQLGMMEATTLLEETLKQEKKADATLNNIALQEVNRKAA